MPVPTNLKKTEHAVIDAILRDYAEDVDNRMNWYEKARSKGVTRSTFTDERCAQLWEYFGKAIADKKTPDLQTVETYCGSNLSQFAADIYVEFATGVNCEQWIDSLLDAEHARKFEAARKEVERKYLAGEVSREIYLDMLKQASDDNRDGSKTLKTVDEVAGVFSAEYLAADPPQLIPVFPPNTQLGRDLVFRRGQILVIAAGAGSGKTQLAIQAVLEQLQRGFHVLYICTETNSEDIFSRMLAPVVGISHYTLLYPNRTEEQVMKFDAARKLICERFGKQLFIQGVNDGSLTITRFGKLMQEVTNRLGGVDVVVVDYIQDIEPIDRKASANENLSKTMSIIAHIVKQYKAAAIILSQINRVGQNAKEKEQPNLSWLKDCSKIGELANTVCILTREKDQSKLTCVKSRDCGRFTVPLEYRGARYVSAPLTVESEKFAQSYGGNYD